MTDQSQPRRLTNDPLREAGSSLRGYAYQFWHSLLAWLRLEQHETLFLEGAEDLDVLRENEAVTAQIRLHSRSITLNSPGIRGAIGHYWDHVARNPDRKISYSYITPASIAREQVDDLGYGRAGLQLWRDVQRMEHAEDWESLVRCKDT